MSNTLELISDAYVRSLEEELAKTEAQITDAKIALTQWGRGERTHRNAVHPPDYISLDQAEVNAHAAYLRTLMDYRDLVVLKLDAAYAARLSEHLELMDGGMTCLVCGNFSIKMSGVFSDRLMARHLKEEHDIHHLRR